MSIKKWYAEQDNLWLIGTFPVLNVNINNYPAIRDYLLIFDKKRLESGWPHSSVVSSAPTILRARCESQELLRKGRK